VISERPSPDEREAQARHYEFLRARAPIPPLAGCPIDWQPNALAPVFSGYRDYGVAEGSPTDVRVFFPLPGRLTGHRGDPAELRSLPDHRFRSRPLCYR
jgi:hypothetical protein